MSDAAPSTVTVAPPVLKLREPAEIVAAVPYLLGFQPVESVVVLSLRGARRRVGLILRGDLPSGDVAADALAAMAEHIARDGAAEAVVVIYADDETGMWPLLRPALEDRGVRVREALRVSAGRWWSYLCGSERCCPTEGTPVVPATETGGPSRVAAQLVHAGMAALPSREALAETIRPDSGVRLLAMEQAVERRVSELAGQLANRGALTRQRAAWRSQLTAVLRDRLEGAYVPLGDDVAASLLLAVLDLPTRDQAAEWVEGVRGEAAISLWTELTRRAPPGYDVAPATLLANTAWRTGHGALARIAVERALAVDPSYRLARLIERALDAGINPVGMRRRELRSRGPRRR